MRLLLAILCLLVGIVLAAPKAAEKSSVKSSTLKAATQKTDAQINEQKNALKKLESDLAQRRHELVQLETEEKGVISTLSLLDRNLNQTRDYINELSKSETMLQRAIVNLSADIDSLDRKIEARKEAMKKRIRMLYVNGRFSEAQVLYSLLSKDGNPERQAYWVHHILYQDRNEVELLQSMVQERDEMKRREQLHLADLKDMRSKKAAEEQGLVLQMNGQEKMLKSLKHDQDMQRRALQEFEQNQKTMLALIKMLEERRKKELEEARKAEEARLAREKAAREKAAKEKAAKDKAAKDKAAKDKAAKEKEQKQKAVEKPKVVVAESVKGPKCTPLKGQIISNYGLQEHPVLHIMTRNLGVEIRGKRGEKVKAAAAGTVVMVAEIDGRGPSVIIEHEGGTYSVYGHLKSIRVQEGKVVQNCEEIGEVGDVASLNGIKLYFQVSEGTQTVDPMHWLTQK